MTDFATKTVKDMHETIEFCENAMSGCSYHVYRPLPDLLAWRNSYLTQVMHHRSHQQEY